MVFIERQSLHGSLHNKCILKPLKNFFSLSSISNLQELQICYLFILSVAQGKYPEVIFYLFSSLTAFANAISLFFWYHLLNTYRS